MKSCAAGLSVRFFSVKIPTGLDVVGKSAGNRLSDGLSEEENANTKFGMIVRKRPVASRALRTGTVLHRTVALGKSSPLARKASPMSEPDRLSGGGSTQASFIKSASFTLRRRVQGFCAPATTISCSS